MKEFIIPEKTSAGISRVPIDSKLFESRNIYIEGEINTETAVLVVKQIHLLSISDENKPINVFISSPGGEITAGMLIYDAIQDAPCPVNTICIGGAYSMGAVLATCGTGKRYILPHSKMMLHEPLISSGAGGSASSVKELSESLNKTKRAINEILAKHTGQPLKVVAKAASYDHYYSAEEAVAFGLADKIVKFNEILKGECE